MSKSLCCIRHAVISQGCQHVVRSPSTTLHTCDCRDYVTLTLENKTTWRALFKEYIDSRLIRDFEVLHLREIRSDTLPCVMEHASPFDNLPPRVSITPLLHSTASSGLPERLGIGTCTACTTAATQGRRTRDRQARRKYGTESRPT